MISRHVDNDPNIAMAKSPVPSLDVRRSGDMHVARVGVFLLGRCQLEMCRNGHVDGKNVEIEQRYGTTRNDDTTFVCNPAEFRAKAACVHVIAAE